VTNYLRGTCALAAACLAFSLSAAAEEVRVVPVFRANGISGVSHLFAHDVDGDGHRDLAGCANSGPFALAQQTDGTWATSWSAPAVGCGGGVAAGDLDGDGGAEIVAAQTLTVAIFDPRGISGPFSTLTIPGSASIGGLAIANVDDDAAPEIVAVTANATYVYDGVTRELQWTATGYGGTSVRIGDIDGDSRPEIVVNGSTAYVLDGAAEVQKWGYVGGFGPAWTLGNVDADAKDEIVFRSGSNVTTLNGDTFTTSSWAESNVDVLAVADADHNGANEIIVGSYYTNLTGRNPATGALLWTIQSGYGSVGSMGAEDLDSDGIPEVFWSKSGGVAVGTVSAGVAQWSSPVSIGPYSSAFGDLDGDGHLEYVVGIRQAGTSSSGSIQVFDGETHALRYTIPVQSYSNYVQEVAIGQLDADPALEIAALIGYYDYYLTVWDGVTGQQEFVSNNGGASLGPSMLVANIDADAIDEIIVSTEDQHVVVLNGASNIIQKSLTTTGGVYDMALANLNGDATGDLTVLTYNAVTVYDTVSWEILGSAALSTYPREVQATSAGGGTVAVSSDSYYNNLRVFKGATLTPAYVCTTGSPERLAFAGVGGEERLIAVNEQGAMRAYPLDGDTCPEDLEVTRDTGAAVELTALDVTGDGRQDLIIDGYYSTTVALLGLSTETRGDVDGDGVITGDDVDDTVDYLFGAQPGSSPMADANADKRISVEDVFKLIDYEFAGGAALP
jgi:hypothetical protein